MPRERLTILHVSGPRFSSNASTMPRSALFGQLHRDIAEIGNRHGLYPDLLIVTGDLADAGLPGEYRQATEFLGALAGSAGIPRRNVAIVPGSHDVNQLACAAHFLTQESLQQKPIPPYFPKWSPFVVAFEEFYAGVGGAAFTPDEPWALFEMPDLGVVVAGMNSTIAETHRDEDRYGQVGAAQLRWFARRLAAYGDQGWLRLAAVNHIPITIAGSAGAGAVAGRGLRDADELDEILGESGLVNMLFSAHPDDSLQDSRPGDGLRSGVPVLAAASVGSAGRYRLITVRRNDFTVYDRRYAGGRWVSGAAGTAWGEHVSYRLTDVDAVFPVRDKKAADDRPRAQEAPPRLVAPYLEFLEEVKEATRTRFPDATVTARPEDGYLRVSHPVPGIGTEQSLVGIVDGELSEIAIEQFADGVHARFASANPLVRSELVYGGKAAAPQLVAQARRRGVVLRSFIEYQGLLDLRSLADAQRERLNSDRLYPAQLYVDQRYKVVSGGSHRDKIRTGLIDQAVQWLRADVARLVVVLGDFGRGKTSFLRQLARMLPTELPDVTPILVELRSLEKGPTLDDLLAQHLVRQGVEDVSQAKLRYMIESGRIALLFDGFDELELRVGYDHATDYLQTLLNSLTGRAKVVLTSRTQHFRSSEQVRTALGERVETRTGGRVVVLEDFTESQILKFLTNLYDGDGARARRRFELIKDMANLLDLTRNPRMLAFVAQLDEKRLRAVGAEGGRISAAELYEEIIDYWLANEEQRQRHRRGLAWLSKDERFAVCTRLALRLWRSKELAASLRDLSAEVTATLTRLAERGFSDEQAAHSIASGSLLVRTDEDAFNFVHQSIMEWLVAADAARDLTDDGPATEVLRTRQMSRLMSTFFADLAGHPAARKWAAETLADQQSPDAAKQNALAVWTQLDPDDRVPGAPPDLQNLVGVDMRNQDLNGRDLRHASLRGANLHGMRLNGTDLTGADLTDTDFTDVVMIKGSLRDATITNSRWDRAVILGVEGVESLAGAPELNGVAIAGRDRVEAVVEPSSEKARCVAFSADGALIAYGSGSLVKITDTATGAVLGILRGHEDTVNAVAFSPDGSLIATASDDQTARTWDTASGTQRTTLTGHDGAVTAVAFSPDSTLIATASDDRTARTWGRTGGSPRTTFTGHDEAVVAVTFAPDGALLVTSSRDNTARTWDVVTGTQRTTLTGHAKCVNSVVFSPDGSLIATASDDRTARTWDTATGNERTTLTGHADAVQGIIFSPDGSLIATASDDQTARTWDTATGTQRTTLTGHNGAVTAVAFSPDSTLIATASDDRTARTWDTASGTQRTTLTGHNGAVTAVAFSPDSTLIATASDEPVARTWSTATGTPRNAFRHDGWVTAVAFSPDNTLIATASTDRTVRTWETATGTQRNMLTGHNGVVTAVAFSPDGTLIATASTDHTALLWETTMGIPRSAVTGHNGAVTAVAFSPDSTLIVTASDDRTARIWDVATGTQLRALTGHHGSITSVAFSPDGALIATASNDCTVRIWSQTGTDSSARIPLPRRSLLFTVRGHRGPVRDTVFSPDGSLLATTSDDGTARIWEVTDGSLQAVLNSYDGPLTAAGFSPYGTLLAIGSRAGTIRIWHLASETIVATLVPLLDGGYATLLPDGRYKLDGDPAERLWWTMKLCRFAPGELDLYIPEIEKLSPDAAIQLGAPQPTPRPQPGSP
jgi:WD40 repeat protein